MAETRWVNAITGNTLHADELADLRSRARAAYAANTHIFEDEADALTALGAVPACAHGAAPPIGTVGISLDDARVAAAVRSALLADADLGLRDIAVDVDRGVVSLSGVVRTADEVQRAATVAQRVTGVRDVKSALKVGS